MLLTDFETSGKMRPETLLQLSLGGESPTDV
jgi:hypothetical protein